MTDDRAVSPQVLIADDDPTVVLLLEHVLEAMKRRYETADDGEQAWEAWQRDRHPLVVLDIEMPKLDGLEVCRRIRAADSERSTFILIVTGRDKAADLEAVLDAGADDYVTKPVTGQRLLARLKIAQRRMAVDEELRKARWLAGIVETNLALQHEINNPLAGLLGTAELLMMDAKEQVEFVQQIEVIVEQARRIAALVKRMGELRDFKSVPYAGGSRMLDLKEPT
jgi:DNA-binding response OmpR family regulator